MDEKLKEIIDKAPLGTNAIGAIFLWDKHYHNRMGSAQDLCEDCANHSYRLFKIKGVGRKAYNEINKMLSDAGYKPHITTWGEFKKRIEESGVSDSDVLTTVGGYRADRIDVRISSDGVSLRFAKPTE